MKLNLLAIICIAILCAILTLGLWPFHSPRNDVTWLESQNGLRFGKYGTVISSGTFKSTSPQDTSEESLEIWLQPKRIWDSGTFLAFCRPGNLLQFSLRQFQTELLVTAEQRDGQHHSTTASLDVKEVFRSNPRPIFIAITSGMEGVRVYIDGVAAAARRHFPLSSGNFKGKLVLGGSPGHSDSWSGHLLGLAIYRRQLTAAQVSHTYATWNQIGRPEVTEEERLTSLYLFDEHSGDVIRDKAGSAMELYIPERYEVLDKVILEPFWTEFRVSQDYWRAIVKNIVGFVPFGFFFYAYYVKQLPSKPAAFVTVTLGAIVSFTIELLQAFLPTRESGTTDIITNTLGTWVGVLSYCLITPLLVGFLLRLPFRGRSPENRR